MRTEPGNLSPRGPWVASFVLVAAGFSVCGYLTVRAFAALGPTGGGDPCSTLFSPGCGGALADGRLWFLNIPLAGWGLVHFTALTGLLFLSRFVGRASAPGALHAAALLALAGAVIGAGLSLVALLDPARLCPLCLAVHGISLLLVPALARAADRPVRELFRDLRGAPGWLVRTESPMPERARWQLVGFGAVALAAAMAYQWVYVEAALRRPHPGSWPDRDQVVATYAASPEVDLPLSADDPHLGPLTAPVRLVVFGSLECPAYRRFAGTLPELQRRFADRLLVVYKHYPLSSRCNARLTRDMQPGACDLALAAEAARLQRRFWAFHDALVAITSGSPEEAVAEAVRRTRLDAARFEADRGSELARMRVAADVGLGNHLSIPGTPTVFLDGRLVRTPRSEVLEILIRHELEPRAARTHGRAIKDLGRLPHESRPS